MVGDSGLIALSILYPRWNYCTSPAQLIGAAIMGRVVHFEIHAENPERAIKFYQGLLGWEFKKWDGPLPYWLITTGPKEQPGINGGLVQRRGTIDGTAVIAYVCTADV